MKKLINLITVERVALLIVIIALILGVKSCNDKRRENEQQAAQIIQLQLDNQRITEVSNKKGETIVLQEVINTHSQAAIKSLTDSIFALKDKQAKQIKKIISYYKGVTKTTIKDKLIPYIDTLAMKQWEDSIYQSCSKVIEYYEANTITVPRTARDSTSEYKATLTATKAGIKIDSINIIDSQYIRFVQLKGGLLKKDTYGKRHFILGRKYQVQVLHTNKSFEIVGENSVIYTPKNRLKLLRTLVFIGGGVFLGKNL